MNRTEISEIRRRFNPDKNTVTRMRGCYVNEKREVISTFDRSLLAMPREEAEKYLAIFKRTLSGMPGRNLLDIEFQPDQVMDGKEHALLMDLRETQLSYDASVNALFDHIIDSIDLDGNYLILLLHDSYDVPRKSFDENKADVQSDEVYSYILCAICPVKLTKPALSYFADDQDFHSKEPDWVVAMPETGFLFPEFTDRGTDLYHALYYVRDTEEMHDDMVLTVFGSDRPAAPDERKEAFQAVLEDALQEDLSLDVVQTVHEELKNRIEENAADKNADAPSISRFEVATILENCGVPEDKVTAFEEMYDEEFGETVNLNPVQLINTRQFEVKTPDVVIKVAPDRSDLIETRVIDGFRYILIKADDGVEVNGVNIRITED